jgi:ABC-2 type transport system ATP-binding protein
VSAATKGAVIRVTDLAKVYRTVRRKAGLAGALKTLFRPEHLEVRAVDGITFQLERGEFVGFLGPNGAGKTTTLKMLSGLLLPSAGSVEVLGYDPWRRDDDFRRSISLVMGQKNQLWWDLPARDSLELNREIYGIPADRWTRLVGEMTERLEVGHRMEVQVRELSLGERMKFELIASLLHEPRVLFLDEPTIGVDVVSQQRIREFLREVNRRNSTTVLLTSHNMNDIKGLADRVLLINHGKLVHDGPLASLVSRWSGFKHLRLTAARDLAREELERYGEVLALEGPSASLKIPHDKAAALAGELLARLPVADISIEDPPIEDVIAEVFRELGPPS